MAIPIRVLCVKSTTLDSTTETEIEKMLNTYGPIEAVRERFYENNQSYLVQFTNAKDAKKALDDVWEEWEVNAANLLDQPEHPLHAPPEDDSDSKILTDINDHCLFEILWHLNVYDLMHASKACKRLNEQAKVAFAANKKRLELDFGCRGSSTVCENVLEEFGKFVVSLFVDADLYEPVAVRSIAEHCVNPRLKTLELCSFKFDSDLDSLRPLMGEIHTLNLFWCDATENLEKLLAVSIQLEQLTLNNCTTHTHHILANKFPSLNQLTLYNCDIELTVFEVFMQKHCDTLTKLSIEGTFDVGGLRVIGQYAKHLNELKLVQMWNNCRYNQNVFRDAAKHVAMLKTLMKIEINLGSNDIQPIMEALVASRAPIQVLEITFARGSTDAVIDSIARLTEIKTLKMHTKFYTARINDTHLMTLANNLKRLEEVTLQESHDFNRLYPNYQFKSQLTTVGLKKMIEQSLQLKSLTLQSIKGIEMDSDLMVCVKNRSCKINIE